MRRASVPSTLLSILAFLGAAGGCFYTDQLNQRPSIEIRRLGPVAVTRTSEVSLLAETADPDGDLVSVAWTARLCDVGATACGETVADLQTGTETSFVAQVAATYVSPATGARVPTRSLVVELRAIDAFGATAVPPQVLVLDVGNASPELSPLQARGLPSAAGSTSFPVGVPIHVIAQRRDQDDALADVVLDWQAPITPVGAAGFTYIADPRDPAHPDVESYTLVPDVAGSWDLVVVARDPADGEATAHITIAVVDDRPPCIAAVTPRPAGAGGFVLVEQPTRFAVINVDDDLDAYPVPVVPGFGDVLGQTAFHWQQRDGDGPWRRLTGVTGNSLTLDPAAHQLGDVVQLRVEIADRVERTLACDQDDPTCSVASTSCVQRLTWRAEIR